MVFNDSRMGEGQVKNEKETPWPYLACGVRACLVRHRLVLERRKAGKLLEDES